MGEKVWIIFHPGYDQDADGDDQGHILGVFDNAQAAEDTAAGVAEVMEVPVRSTAIPSRVWYKVALDEWGHEHRGLRGTFREWAPYGDGADYASKGAFTVGYSLESGDKALELAREAIAAQGE